ncbi:MAG: bifunctional glutamate N-acetyltransferase/amino-acid acetyltransferase ArgJ [Candidatus Omnitrophota bacterium]
MTIKAALPLGYRASGIACGIKKSGKPDLGLIFSQSPARAAGLFTANKITSGSVKLSRINLGDSRSFRAIIANSGNANCFILPKRRSKTKASAKGDPLRTAREIAGELARLLKIKEQEVLFASTGIIGKPLPAERVKKSLPSLIKDLSKSGLAKTARAILTTDTFAKTSARVVNIGKKPVAIYGMAKGAGMIAPNLATMLCFILSDANITRQALRAALKGAADETFNCITVDGCMSTNDTVFIMSNSCSGNPEIREGSGDFKKFFYALRSVCLDLAKMIVRDAEGATKFIRIRVKQAGSFQEARRAALSIANSNLFKTAMFGSNRNLGRIVAAVGASGIEVKEGNLKLNAGPLNKKDIYVEVGFGRGKSEATVYTSDLTPEYVKINAEYS